jgi:hypothetical protein
MKRNAVILLLILWSTVHAAGPLADAPATFGRRIRAKSEAFAAMPAPIPAGIAGGSRLLFVGSPLEGRVSVLSRASGQVIAELPQPPSPFVLPLILHSIGPSRIAVLDSGGFPEPGVVDANPTIYEYEYSYRNGKFSATLARTVSFTNVRIGFAEEFVYLGKGRYLVPDSVYGAIWRVTSSGAVVPGIVPRTYDAVDAFASMAYCPTMPPVTVGGLPFLFVGGTIPGIAGIAVRNNTVYFTSSCAGALYRFDYRTLFDRRQPHERADDIRLIATKPAGVEVEELLELQFNPFDQDDPYLYAADAMQLRVIAINPSNGRRHIVGDDPRLFNFPASIAFVPPGPDDDSAPMLVLSNQQHRDPLLNPAVTVDHIQLPYLITKVSLRE